MSQFEHRLAVAPNLQEGLQGYGYGLRQPAQILTLSLQELPLDLSWTRIDAWLEAWLDDPLDENLNDQKWLKSGEQYSNAARLAWRIAVAAATLLRVCGIPFLEPGRVLSVFPAATSISRSVKNAAWQCELAIPRVDGIPPQVIMMTYDICTAWLLHVVTSPPIDDLLSRFYQQLETQTLSQLLASTQISSSAMVLLRTAHEKNIPWSYEGQGICQLGWGEKSLRFLNTSIESDSVIGTEAAGHKYIAAQWLRRVGLPAPEHHLMNSKAHAVQAAHLLGWPVVIKPADCERGEGVSIDVNSDLKVHKAFENARLLSAQVLVERQVPGSCHRVLVVRGEVMYVVKRLPIAVQGDGYHTVAELMATKMDSWRKQPPWRRPPPLIVDELAKQCLYNVGLAFDSIPQKGQWAPLRRIESTADGGLDEDMIAVLHPDNKALAIRAAALFGMDVAGVDIISTDISVPWHMNGAIINEINAAPSMGAGPSSKAAMPAVIECLIRGNGRIRIEAFIGGDAAFSRAQQRQKKLVAEGVACYLISHQLTQDETGNNQPMACEGLFLRCRALLMDKSVGAIILVIQNDELIQTGLPVDVLDRIETVDNGLCGNTEQMLHLINSHAAVYVAGDVEKLY
jgi:cyanophycin synthetase